MNRVIGVFSASIHFALPYCTMKLFSLCLWLLRSKRRRVDASAPPVAADPAPSAPFVFLIPDPRDLSDGPSQPTLLLPSHQAHVNADADASATATSPVASVIGGDDAPLAAPQDPAAQPIANDAGLEDEPVPAAIVLGPVWRPGTTITGPPEQLPFTKGPDLLTLLVF